MKKILSFILAALLVLSMGAVALADGNKTIDTTDSAGNRQDIDVTLTQYVVPVIDVDISWDSTEFLYVPGTEAEDDYGAITRNADDSTDNTLNVTVTNNSNVEIKISAETAIAETFEDYISATMTNDGINEISAGSVLESGALGFEEGSNSTGFAFAFTAIAKIQTIEDGATFATVSITIDQA